MFDGKAFGLEVVEAVKSHVAKVLDPLVARLDALEARQPERGEKGEPGDRGADGIPGDIGPAGERGEPGPAGEPGPPGERGQDGSVGPAGPIGEKGDPGPVGDVGPAGERGKDGRDGVGLAGAILGRGGELIVTMTDGTTRDLGVVVGKDGSPGADGSDGKDGRDGRDGKDGAAGRDGISFDAVEQIDDPKFYGVRFFVGKDAPIEMKWLKPTLADADRGIWKEGNEYSRGDVVTHGGSAWVCHVDGKARPGTGEDWRLMVKHGRDGKEGKQGERGPPGPKGDPVPVPWSK